MFRQFNFNLNICQENMSDQILFKFNMLPTKHTLIVPITYSNLIYFPQNTLPMKYKCETNPNI